MQIKEGSRIKERERKEEGQEVVKTKKEKEGDAEERSADAGSICPALPFAIAAHPVTSTRMSFSIRRLVSVT